MNDNEHEMLKSDQNYKKSDDNFQRVKEKMKKHKEELKVKVKKQTANIKVKASQVKEKLLKKNRNQPAELKVTFVTKDQEDLVDRPAVGDKKLSPESSPLLGKVEKKSEKSVSTEAAVP